MRKLLGFRNFTLIMILRNAQVSLRLELPLDFAHEESGKALFG
jgi:hypothetical protein